MSRILLVADIHSNWSALSAIQEDFDACIVAGDIVDYGTNPIPCIEWVRKNATVAVRGNHDHAVAQRVAARSGAGFRALAAATRPVHWDLLRPSQMKYLARLPVMQQVEIGGLKILVVHGTPRDPMDEYLREDKSAWRNRLEGLDVDLVCVGHTHHPMYLDLGDTQVINPGSVGQPRDGDARAAYVIIENNEVMFKRVTYNIEESIKNMRVNGIDRWAIELTEQLLRSGGHPDSFRGTEADAQ
ncbi:phosphodiesterase [Polystyrenella longa]|uniref:Phosphoesterase n=1 Tax=Polystyrenella longa TaxID=2528007 RepID=A0A518CS10_9PLAN|nr:YfcE family phosphodiesterase [Polystyrenella longa]QDU82011.1 phosphodiesterase [Polystyrenella longa]